MNPDLYTVRYMAWNMACAMALNGKLEPQEVRKMAGVWERFLMGALKKGKTGAVVSLAPMPQPPTAA